MAELPEVETIRRQLAEAVGGVPWESLDVRPGRIFHSPARQIADRLKGAKLDAVERRGKALVLVFDNGHALLVHLGMSGQVLLVPPAEPSLGHRHLAVGLGDGRELVFRDPRKFGYLRLVRREEAAGTRELSGIGPDPLDPALTWDKFTEMLKARGGRVKSLLIDQGLFAGVGNIYSDEILYAARIHPARQTTDLTPIELKELYHAIRSVLSVAIGYGGTSFDEAFVDLYGRSGLYGGCLKVYGREREPCLKCSTPLKGTRIGGRTSVFCPHCQK